MTSDLDAVLGTVGPRLKAFRVERNLTLTEVAAASGVSASTLSRLEAGQRRPNLELLLPLARLYGVPLDDMVDAPPTGDPRIHLKPITHAGMTAVPLTRRPGGLQAFKMVLEGDARGEEPDPRVHEGYEWLYVLNGRLRLVLGGKDFELRPGEAAEFDTHTPHWFASADGRPVELISLFGQQGERMHIRARPKSASTGHGLNKP
ncbi:helix-turn-helix domain-containing protein [Pseudarthrobacter sp. C4D7]|uniref:helix-turn-helix domain-containing protein n=1 Tax=Pseudarthrobacter sp. C4D7 TaxID=2735268 RepID=UPI001584D12A|nr:XRE family transcriptional regulator [Pseudarthrobacter sp. C4D7]NUT70898.1 helix-turn-helix transcriptional regulator [Pseudarthrobacter sp. C4D7]